MDFLSSGLVRLCDGIHPHLRITCRTRFRRCSSSSPAATPPGRNKSSSAPYTWFKITV